MSRTVGIFGGGQLGSMLADALRKLGARVGIFDPDPLAPAQAAAHFSVTAAYTDPAQVKAFAEQCDILTYEVENVPLAPLQTLEGAGHRFYPNSGVLRITQERSLEKAFFRDNGLPCVGHGLAKDVDGLLSVAERLAFPLIAKTCQGGYDGKGQWSLASMDDVSALAAELGEGSAAFPLLLEERVPLAAEASCIVAVDHEGYARTLPVFDNEHEAGILAQTFVPSRLPQAVQARLSELAISAAEAMGVRGLLTVEFFLVEDPAVKAADWVDGFGILLNEMAPRPHNSGHVTLNACNFSQFDALARILCHAPLGPCTLRDGHFAMGNLLGDVWLAQGAAKLNLQPWQDFPQVMDIVLYGKAQAKSRRKMGHFVVNATERGAARELTAGFLAALSDTNA